jgi:hypothetical protein
VCECSTWNRTFGWGTWRGVRNGHCARLPARSCRIIRTLVLYHAGWPLVAYIFQLCSLVRLAPLCREKNLSDPARRVRLHSQTHGNVPAGADSDAHTVVVIAPCKCLPRTRHIASRWGEPSHRAAPPASARGHNGIVPFASRNLVACGHAERVSVDGRAIERETSVVGHDEREPTLSSLR